MKSSTFLLIFICHFFCSSSLGQSDNSNAAPGISFSKIIDGKMIKINNSSVIKDSLGTQINFDKWFSQLMTGEYDVKLLPLAEGQEQAFLIYKKTPEEIEKFKRMMEQNKTSNTNSLISGLPIGDFKIQDINGAVYTNDNLKGKTVLINFWFIACAPCIKEIPELNELKGKFNKKDVIFLAVNNSDSKESIEKYLLKKKFDYLHIAREQASSLYFIESINAFPSYIVLDKNGIIRHIASGYSDTRISQIEKIIENAL